MDRLDAVEFVKTKGGQPGLDAGQKLPDSLQRPSPAIISGNRSLTLGDRYVVYRDIVAGQPIVTILPFWSIDSFSVTVFRPRSMAIIAASCFLASVWAWLHGPILVGNTMFVSLWSYRVSVHQLIGALFLLVGLIAATIYIAYPRPQLVIHNQSGKNKIRFVLPRRIDNALEEFVTQVEAQMGRV
jgi:hypothetical protein